MQSTGALTPASDHTTAISLCRMVARAAKPLLNPVLALFTDGFTQENDRIGAVSRFSTAASA